MNKRAWKILRATALEVLGNTCKHCGIVTDAPHVDHIYPRSEFPELALDPHNVQVLCPDCNRDKGAGVFSASVYSDTRLEREAIRLEFIDALVSQFEVRESAMKLVEQAHRIKSRRLSNA